MKKQTYNGPERRQQAWHLDKKVPITIVTALVVQTLALVWQASALNSAVKENADNLTETIKRVSDMETRERETGKMMAKVETMLENLQHTVYRIDNALDERQRGKMK